VRHTVRIAAHIDYRSATSRCAETFFFASTRKFWS